MLYFNAEVSKPFTGRLFLERDLLELRVVRNSAVKS